VPRNKTQLLGAVSAPTGAQRNWAEAGGRIYSVEAVLGDGATAAVVNLYGSNSGKGGGVLIGDITLSSTTPSDGMTFSDDDGGWFFVAAELVSNTGPLQSCTACVSKE
jgi:hypothetical protein